MLLQTTAESRIISGPTRKVYAQVTDQRRKAFMHIANIHSETKVHLSRKCRQVPYMPLVSEVELPIQEY